MYRYVVKHTPSAAVSVSAGLLQFPSRFSFHGLDAIAFFGGLEFVLGKPPSDEDKSFQSVITQHLVGFAKTGEKKPKQTNKRSSLFDFLCLREIKYINIFELLVARVCRQSGDVFTVCDFIQIFNI